jgi:hypothetical protein
MPVHLLTIHLNILGLIISCHFVCVLKHFMHLQIKLYLLELLVLVIMKLHLGNGALQKLLRLLLRKYRIIQVSNSPSLLHTFDRESCRLLFLLLHLFLLSCLLAHELVKN